VVGEVGARCHALVGGPGCRRPVGGPPLRKRASHIQPREISTIVALLLTGAQIIATTMIAKPSIGADGCGASEATVCGLQLVGCDERRTRLVQTRYKDVGVVVVANSSERYAESPAEVQLTI
jgi:hypothetical protein